jgi:hypothetical protein
MLTTSSSCPRLSRVSTSFYLRCSPGRGWPGTSPAMTTDLSILPLTNLCRVPIPVLSRAYARRVLSGEGALEGTPKGDRAKAGRRGNPTADAAPAAVVCTHGPGRLRVSVRPHYGGSATEAGWTGTGERREIARSHVPGSADQGLKTPRRNAERRCRVPLFPGNPGDKPRLVEGAPFGVPPPLTLGVRSQQSSGSREPRECDGVAV